MKRFVLLLAGAVLAVMAGAAPAAALETTTFGLDVAEPSEDGRLTIAVRAGATTTGRLRVWNKQTTAVTLRLTVAPASVDAAGGASLGGDVEPTRWVSVEPTEVRLAAGERREVTVRVEAPRRLERGRKVVAVVAEPALVGDQPPAVLQRLAVTTFLVPVKDGLVAELGGILWVAVAVLTAVAVAVAMVVGKRRRRPVEPDAPAA